MILTILMGCSLLTALFGQRVSDPLRSAVHYVIVPPGDGAMYLVTQFKKDRGPKGPAVTAEEAGRLRQENEVLWQQHHALIEQNNLWKRRATLIEKMYKLFEKRKDDLRGLYKKEELHRLYGRTWTIPYDLVAASVVAVESLPYGTRRVLGTGRSRGVMDGAPVTTLGLITDRAKALPKKSAAVIPWPQNLMTVSSAALVGRITKPSQFAATLQLVTDQGFRINARIRRKIDLRNPRMIVPRRGGSPERLTKVNNKLLDVVAVGDGKRSILVKDVPKGDAVRVGDHLVSRTDEPFLPVQISIGTVVEVMPDPDKPIYCNLRVEPRASLEALREVYIVVPLARPGEGWGEGRR